MADPSEEIAALRAAVAALHDQVAALQRELQGARQHIDLTMRGQLRCRACGCRRIAHAPRVLDRGDADQRHDMALFQPKWWSGKTRGKLETYLCTQCGLVEWWVSDPAALEPHDEYLQILDGDAGPQDPYR